MKYHYYYNTNTIICDLYFVLKISIKLRGLESASELVKWDLW
jgi:hypothetical protein